VVEPAAVVLVVVEVGAAELVEETGTSTTSDSPGEIVTLDATLPLSDIVIVRGPRVGGALSVNELVTTAEVAMELGSPAVTVPTATIDTT
jgi:hypothetical protein